MHQDIPDVIRFLHVSAHAGYVESKAIEDPRPAILGFVSASAKATSVFFLCLAFFSAFWGESPLQVNFQENRARTAKISP